MHKTTANSAASSHKDHRRQQLIDATIKTISQYGLSNTTIAKVTEQADLSAGIVGFYFNSKARLLLGTLQWLNEELRRHTQTAFNDAATPMEKLIAVIDVYFAPTLCDQDKIAVWYAFSSESNARNEYTKICSEHYTWLHQSMLGQVQSLCRQAKIDAASAEAITRGLDGIIDGYWQDFLYQPDIFDRKQARQTCYRYLHTIFPQLTQPFRTVHKDLNETELSDCLPTWTYYDEEFLELEKRTVFKNNWLLVGHINDMPNPRDYLTLDAIDERVIVIRGNDKQIRAFHNVCRHRGAKLFDALSGQCGHALVCPFHGWTYQLDGKLIGVPAENTFTSLDKSANGLVPLELEIWMGFIFVRFVSDGQALAEQMKPLEAVFAAYRIENMLPLENSGFDEILPYNWKVIHDIDNEGYHVPVGHPALHQLYGKNYQDSDIAGIPVSYGYINEKPGKLWSVRHYQSLLPKFDHLPQDYQRLWQYGAIFPSMVIALYPDCIEFYMTIPVAADQTRLRGGVYALADNRRGMDAVRYLNRRINAITADEDEKYVRWLQDGMKSSVFPEPSLSSIEHGVRTFHHQLQAIIPVGKLKNHPGKGKVIQTNSQLIQAA